MGVSHRKRPHRDHPFDKEVTRLGGRAFWLRELLPNALRITLVQRTEVISNKRDRSLSLVVCSLSTGHLGEAVSPGGTVSLDNVPAAAKVDLALLNGDEFVWWIAAGSQTDITIPPLPEGATVLEGDDVRFRPQYCEVGTIADEYLCIRAAFGAVVDAAPRRSAVGRRRR